MKKLLKFSVGMDGHIEPCEDGQYVSLEDYIELEQLLEKARLEGIALGIGWAHTNSCSILDNGGDPRKVDIPTQLEKAFDDLERNKLEKE